MSETLLKKEFKKSDVERIRNLVKKDFTAKTKVASGYKKSQVVRKEGEVWEEDGRSWTIQNGLKQNITKLDTAKNAYKIPLRCPKCNGSMSHWLAKKMYRIHGFCFDCTVDYEASLKKAGKYEEYEKAMMQGNVKEFARDLEQYIIDKLEETSDFVTEQGDVEDWKNDSTQQRDRILKELASFTKQVNKSLQK